MAARDFQQQAVYRAEDAWRTMRSASGQSMAGRVLADLTSMSAHLNQWAADCGIKGMDVKPMRKGVTNKASCSIGKRIVNIPQHQGWARLQGTLLHEFVHQIVWDVTTTADHGPVFTGTMVDLVQRFMGDESAMALACCYSKEGVKVGASAYSDPAGAQPAAFTSLFDLVENAA